MFDNFIVQQLCSDSESIRKRISLRTIFFFFFFKKLILFCWFEQLLYGYSIPTTDEGSLIMLFFFTLFSLYHP